LLGIELGDGHEKTLVHPRGGIKWDWN